MSKFIHKLSLSVAYLALSLSAPTLLPTPVVASNTIVDENVYFENKYAFSCPTFLVNKVMIDLFRANENKNKSDELMSLLTKESIKGDTEAQQKLYLLYTQKVAKLDLSDAQKAISILQLGLDQKQGWAYWAYAEKNKTSPNHIMKEHFLASNMSYPKAMEYFEKNYREKWSPFVKELLSELSKETLIKGKKKQKELLQKKTKNIKDFCKKWVEEEWALPLVEMYQGIKKLNDFYQYKELYNFILKSAANLGNIGAQLDYAFIQYDKPNFSLSYMYFQKAANQGNTIAMYDAGKLIELGFEGQKPDKALAFRFYEQAAKQGDTEAMYNAATLLSQGFEGQVPDQIRAFQFCEQAAKQGHILAMSSTGILLSQGFEGQIPDKARAFQFYEQAAKQGNLIALNNAAILLNQGFEGQIPDKARALQYFQQAAKQGDIDAIYNMAILLDQGFEGQAPDKAGALQLYEQTAKQGHILSMNSAGGLLSKGFKGQEPDKARAFFYFQQAAQQGHVEAIYNAGVLLDQGFVGQNPDEARALQLYEQAAEKGYPAAMYNAGILLDQGFKGQEPDKARAFQFYEQAATHGIIEAMHNAGILLHRGFAGQAPDIAGSLHYFQRAAEKENVGAMYNAGVILYQGFEGQAADIAGALRYFQRAAEKGHIEAMHNVGVLLDQGFAGQASDKAHALQYFQQAATQEYPKAMVHLALLYLESYLNESNQSNLHSALFWLEKAQALKDEQAYLYLTTAQRYLNEAYSYTEKDPQLESLLDETKNMVFKKAIGSFEPSHTISRERLKLEESKEEEATDSEEEKNSEKNDSVIIENHYSFPKETKERNFKKIRENLRKMALLKTKLLQECQVQPVLKLSLKAQKIAEAIRTEKTNEVDFNALRILFKEPFFSGKVEITQTKCGIFINAYNRSSNQYASASTHRKHTRSYKGIQPAFVKDLKYLLEIFPNMY